MFLEGLQKVPLHKVLSYISRDITWISVSLTDIHVISLEMLKLKIGSCCWLWFLLFLLFLLFVYHLPIIYYNLSFLIDQSSCVDYVSHPPAPFTIYSIWINSTNGPAQSSVFGSVFGPVFRPVFGPVWDQYWYHYLNQYLDQQHQRTSLVISIDRNVVIQLPKGTIITHVWCRRSYKGIIEELDLVNAESGFRPDPNPDQTGKTQTFI